MSLRKIFSITSLVVFVISTCLVVVEAVQAGKPGLPTRRIGGGSRLRPVQACGKNKQESCKRQASKRLPI